MVNSAWTRCASLLSQVMGVSIRAAGASTQVVEQHDCLAPSHDRTGGIDHRLQLAQLDAHGGRLADQDVCYASNLEHVRIHQEKAH